MNRDELYKHWESKNKLEAYLRERCGPARYKLLWDLRQYFEECFRIDLDDNNIVNFDLIEEYVKKDYQPHDIHTVLSQYNHNFLNDSEESVVITGIIYLVVLIDLKSYYWDAFIFTLKEAILKIAKSRSAGEVLHEYNPLHEELTSNILLDFQEAHFDN